MAVTCCAVLLLMWNFSPQYPPAMALAGSFNNMLQKLRLTTAALNNRLISGFEVAPVLLDWDGILVNIFLLQIKI